MKICYIATLPSTIKSFFIPQLKYLAHNGFEVYVVCSNDNALQNQLGDNIIFYPIDIPRGVSFVKTIKAIKELRKFFKENPFDMVQYCTPNASFCASIASKKEKIKIRNYHLMGYRFLGDSGIKRIILKKLEKLTCYLSTHIECVSQSNLDLGINERFFSKSKAVVVLNGSSGGVDTNRFNYFKRDLWRKEVRKELNIGTDEFVFGFVGRMTRDKGINEILSAFKHLNDNSRLVLVGGFEKKHFIDQQLLKDAKLNSKICFCEYSLSIEKYYAAFDVLLLPSYREGFGNVIIEAAACGTPSIVSNIPGPKDIIIAFKTGIFCKPKNSDTLLNAMKTIQEMDYVAMGKLAYEYVSSRFSSDVLNEAILCRKKYLIEEVKDDV